VRYRIECKAGDEDLDLLLVSKTLRLAPSLGGASAATWPRPKRSLSCCAYYRLGLRASYPHHPCEKHRSEAKRGVLKLELVEQPLQRRTQYVLIRLRKSYSQVTVGREFWQTAPMRQARWLSHVWGDCRSFGITEDLHSPSRFLRYDEALMPGEAVACSSLANRGGECHRLSNFNA
jgi:hypothetical protein